MERHETAAYRANPTIEPLLRSVARRKRKSAFEQA
jgi:hypothetical protein